MAAAGKFGGGDPPCVMCEKRVYKMEEMTLENKVMHKTCFRCLTCDRQLSLGNFAAVAGKLYCKVHYFELFSQSGGKYAAFGADDQFKHKSSTSFAGGITGGGVNVPTVGSHASSSSAAAPPAPAPAARSKSAPVEDSASSDRPLSGTFIDRPLAGEAGESSSSPKRTSIKERLAAYTNVAAAKSSSGSEDDAGLGSTVSSAASDRPLAGLGASSASASAPRSPSGKAAASTASAPAAATATGAGKPATRNAGTTAHAETREASTSFGVATGEGAGAGYDVGSLQAENAALKAKVTELTAQVARLKSELAVQTAKALESDEWVAKLATDKEGSAAKEAVKLSAKLHEHSSPKAGERKSPKGDRKKSPKSGSELSPKAAKAEQQDVQEQEQQSGGESGLSEGSPRKEKRQSKMEMFLTGVSSVEEDA
jgi:hypothetical protein